MFAERALFYRERAAGFYSEAPYLLARCAVNAALQPAAAKTPAGPAAAPGP